MAPVVLAEGSILYRRSAKPLRDRYLVLCIGGGATGITVGHWLQKRVRTEDFAILERNNDMGGTWQNNQYPGCGVDVNVFLYSFSFYPKYDWSETFAKQQENLQYMQEAAHDLGILPFVQFNTEATQMVWNAGESCWEVGVKNLVDGTERTVKADFVINGTGFFSLPQLPSIPGIDSFQGKQCHSAQWDMSIVLEGKKVVLVGNGASGLQIVENITPKVAQLDIFQSNPSWIAPRNSQKLSNTVKWMLKYLPGYAKAMRAYVYLLLDTSGWKLRRMDDPEKVNDFNLATRKALEDWYKSALKDPKLVEKITPKYPPGCHRMLPADLYFDCIQQPHVTLRAAPEEKVVEVTPTGVVTSTGEKIDCDVIIWATGFQFYKYLRGLKIIGRDGFDLQKEWSNEEPDTFYGLMVSKCPNLFLTNGPRGFLGYNSHIFGLECAAEFACNTIKGCLQRGIRTVEVKDSEQRKFVEWFETEIRKFLWDAPIAGCGSYYKNHKGHSNFIYPASGTHYWLNVRRTDFSKMDVTYGRGKVSYTTLLDYAKVALLAAAVYTAVQRYRNRKLIA
ncbi:hypothetical protein DFJ74DRAFT_689392 [Hyaloraphidium curvatum]|nr:hypothetical protein DFJ74DRAFT_689392 [Hyaloraphidium curvatum]